MQTYLLLKFILSLKGRERIPSSPKNPGEIILNHNVIKKNLPDGIPNNNTRLSRALESFPSEVQLCTSSIPCVVYGVCARKHIPTGTWIGPYEGKHFEANSMITKENFYMWEVRTLCDTRLIYKYS